LPEQAMKLSRSIWPFGVSGVLTATPSCLLIVHHTDHNNHGLCPSRSGRC
jgi:hypothetical protein